MKNSVVKTELRSKRTHQFGQNLPKSIIKNVGFQRNYAKIWQKDPQIPYQIHLMQVKKHQNAS